MSENNFYMPAVKSFDDIFAKVKEKTSVSKPRTVLAVPHESAMLGSFMRAINENLIEPYIIGDETLFRKTNSSANIDFDKIHFIDINQPDQAVITASQMAARGEIDLIVKGTMSAEEFLCLLFKHESGFVKKGHLVSHIGVLQPDDYKKLLMITDCGVNIDNDLNTLISITTNSITFARKIGIEQPRVAVLAAVEVVYPQMDSTVKGAVLSKLAERNQLKGAYIDGPLSFDVAVDMEAAHGKGITNSMVAGQADIMIAPDIDTGNGIYKAMTLFGDTRIGSVVFGGAVPVTLNAFIDSDDTRFNSILLGILAI